MPIETICQNCARKLRVGDEHAGRKARCPHCKEVYTVPQLVGDAAPRPTGDLWSLRTENGNVYGPASKTDIDTWLTEGRITSACHLQRADSVEWIPAPDVYPVLTRPAAQPTTANPFAEGASAQPTNPYSPPRPAHPTVRARNHTPHRGGLILTFGVIGIACCVILAPVAWVMGQNDLAQIRSGRMDPAGRGLTQAGMILGIIGTIILACQVLFGLMGFLAG